MLNIIKKTLKFVNENSDSLQVFMTLLIAIVGGCWVAVTYSKDELNRRYAVLEKVDEYFYGMIQTCTNDASNLEEYHNLLCKEKLTDDEKYELECYESFHNLLFLLKTKKQVVKNTYFFSWLGYPFNLGKQWEKAYGIVSDFAENKYDKDATEQAWDNFRAVIN